MNKATNREVELLEILASLAVSIAVSHDLDEVYQSTDLALVSAGLRPIPRFGDGTPSTGGWLRNIPALERRLGRG